MNRNSTYWNMTVLDANPGKCTELHSMLVKEFFGDGEQYIFTGGKEGLFWYNVTTKEKGVVAETGFFHVGLDAADMDGDGKLELYAAEQDTLNGVFKVVCFLPYSDINLPWKKVVIDAYCAGNPHDIVFNDIDGDGELEMVTVAAYTDTPGVFIYKFDKFPSVRRYQIMEGHLTEGIKFADLDGDGKMEIISGPDYYHMPSGGAYSGYWERVSYAKNFRDMCRMDVVDITGNGSPDIVIVESEYCDGQFSWFENRLSEAEKCFVEHRIADNYVFAHSLQAIKMADGVKVMLAEMCEGGWNQPYNFDARVELFCTTDNGKNWACETISYGQGSHQGVMYDIDGDGELELVTKTWQYPMVHILKKPTAVDPVYALSHMFVDRDKPAVGTDIFGAKLTDGDGDDIVCGKWWYDGESYERHELPCVNQAICAFDVDGDGVIEIIGTKKRANHEFKNNYQALGCELVCLKPIDAKNDAWEVYDIGEGTGPWPHGIAISNKLLENGNTCLALAYHDDGDIEFIPELFEMKALGEPWVRTPIGDKVWKEELVIADINGDGKVEIVSGMYWYENTGDKNFVAHKFSQKYEGCRIVVADINGDGLPDIIAGDETCNYETGKTEFGQLVWFKNPGGDCKGLWDMQVIDAVRSPHSLSYGDIDGDGIDEIVVGEHDPFKPYRSRSRLFAYKNRDKKGLYFDRYTIDSRFEHHDGAKIIDIKGGRKAVVSHGWSDSQFVHIWKK